MTDEQLSEARRLCEAATAVSDSLGFCPECDYGFGAEKEPIMWNGLCRDCHQQWFYQESKRLVLALLDAYQQAITERDAAVKSEQVYLRGVVAEMSQAMRGAVQVEAERDALRNLFAASERNNTEWNRYAMRLSLLLDTMTAERDALRSGSKGEA